MKTIAGALLIVAAAILFAAGTLADATMAAANTMGNKSGLSLLAAGIVGFAGLVLLGIGLMSDSQPRQ